LAKNEYLLKLVKICAHLRYSICKALGIEMTDKWYTHAPKPVSEQDIKVFGNEGVHTDREVTASRPDIINTKKKRKHEY